MSTWTYLITFSTSWTSLTVCASNCSSSLGGRVPNLSPSANVCGPSLKTSPGGWNPLTLPCRCVQNLPTLPCKSVPDPSTSFTEPNLSSSFNVCTLPSLILPYFCAPNFLMSASIFTLKPLNHTYCCIPNSSTTTNGCSLNLSPSPCRCTPQPSAHHLYTSSSIYALSPINFTCHMYPRALNHTQYHPVSSPSPKLH